MTFVQITEYPGTPDRTAYGMRVALAVVMVCGTGCAAARGTIDLAPAASGAWQVVDRSPVIVIERGRQILRFDERAGGGAAWNPALQLADGDIDVDVRGRNVPQKSFVGVTFHMTSGSEFEVLWLRPFNFASADSVRRLHAVQYASYPAFSWEVLRAQHPGAYEAAVPSGTDPDGWVHLHIELRGTHVALYLNGATTPVLAVESLGGRTTGPVGLWVGSQSNGDFANLRVRAGAVR